MHLPTCDVHAYKDYRDLLKARYEEMRAANPKFSHRYFCRVAGYGSSSAFGDILKGRRRLSPTAAMRLARALHLTKAEEEYFLNLAGFNQAGSLEEKNRYYSALLALRRVKMDALSPGKYEYFRKWYHAAIRELLYFHPCVDDYQELGRLLDPPIPASQAARAVKLLARLGMIERDPRGRWRQTAAMVKADDLGGTLHVENFQAETMRLGIQALERHPRTARHMSTLTATLSAESVEKVKTAIKGLCDCVLALAEQDQAVDRVYQVNIQLFPLTRLGAPPAPAEETSP